jgi:hypothetical protein
MTNRFEILESSATQRYQGGAPTQGFICTRTSSALPLCRETVDAAAESRAGSRRNGPRQATRISRTSEMGQ